MAHLSTHVLDASRGQPANSIGVTLFGPAGTAMCDAKTDDGGRISEFGVDLDIGIYRLTFDTAAYFASQNVTTFYPEVTITFEVTDPSSKYHVPLLLSPFSYSTYRGS